jgi:predicted alpha/beta hydrolase family esterase
MLSIRNATSPHSVTEEALKKIGIVFIHGLTGGSETWKNSHNQTFGELLLQTEIGEQIEVHHFDYYTKIVTVFDSALAKRILGRIPLLRNLAIFQGKIQRNQPIEQLAEQFSTWIRLNLSHLDQVILIAHSMGGLIAKDYILNFAQANAPRTTGYLSIAVPHKGSLSAQILSPINKNAEELVPLNEYTSRLNDTWVSKKQDPLEHWYVVASNDECVDKESAIPGTVSKNQKFTVDHDHLSVCKPKNISDPVLKCSVLLIQKLISKAEKSKILEDESIATPPSYEKEIFVIKLILGSIEKPGIENAKEAFFQAEIIEKLSNPSDRQKLATLQRLVVNLYRSIYVSHTGTPDRNKLFSEVHRQIVKEDSGALKCAVDSISFLHKQGLLHKSANQLTEEVIWTSSYEAKEIEGLAK